LLPTEPLKILFMSAVSINTKTVPNYKRCPLDIKRFKNSPLNNLIPNNVAHKTIEFASPAKLELLTFIINTITGKYLSSIFPKFSITTPSIMNHSSGSYIVGASKIEGHTTKKIYLKTSQNSDVAVLVG